MSLATRVIARLDIKPGIGVVKPIRFEGLRKVGEPAAMAQRYDEQGIDELLYVDVTASLYGRNALMPLIKLTSDTTFTPLTVCGGIRTFEDFRQAMRWGADKVAMNTGALANPKLITECARAFGAQAVVLSIEAKSTEFGWFAYYNGGREASKRAVLNWAHEAVMRGAGEVLITSIDHDGTRQGYDLNLIRCLRAVLPGVVITASGGCGRPQDCVEALRAGASAVALGTWLHGGGTVGALKAALADAGVEVRV